MSVANTAVVPAQDVLDLGSDARMNFPGKPAGNWAWRLEEGQLNTKVAEKVRRFALLYDRCSDPPKAAKHAPPKKPEY
jgi:4-alpha-glucanotransferase